MDRRETLERRMEILKIKRGVDSVSPFDPELGFITNAEEIRQIALRSLKRHASKEDPYGEENWDEELDTIHPYLDFIGLYPETIRPYNISPDGYNTKSEIMAKVNEILTDMYEERKARERLIDEQERIINKLKNKL